MVTVAGPNIVVGQLKSNSHSIGYSVKKYIYEDSSFDRTGAKE